LYPLSYGESKWSRAVGESVRKVVGLPMFIDVRATMELLEETKRRAARLPSRALLFVVFNITKL
jgi:hypothetical protein